MNAKSQSNRQRSNRNKRDNPRGRGKDGTGIHSRVSEFLAKPTVRVIIIASAAAVLYHLMFRLVS